MKPYPMADFVVSTKVAGWLAVDLVAGGWGLLEAGYNLEKLVFVYSPAEWLAELTVTACRDI